MCGTIVINTTFLPLIILRLISFFSFFYSNCLEIIKNRLPLQHLNEVKEKCMNINTTINLEVLHIIRLVVVASKV